MRKYMNVTLYRPARRILSGRWAIPAVAGAGAVLSVSSSAFAASDMGALFALVDVSGAKSSIFTVLSAMVAIGLLFFGRRLLRQTGVSV
ncbi:MAG: hypothetical protein D3914_00705 [Candidatus Electrothrix sp. LOE2]|nr:hypothetical protein [Candidatus Electrothrix sp. LOE2]